MIALPTRTLVDPHRIASRISALIPAEIFQASG